MNFAWFASAYDNDDVPYRVTTLVQISGALILAAGVPRAFESNDTTVLVIGYVLMRIAMIAQWLRAAHDDPGHRGAAARYAVGIAIVQAGWVGRLALGHHVDAVTFLVLVLAEILVPVFAEQRTMTPWHPHHIAERHGLFTLIVLAESILAATTALRGAASSGHDRFAIARIAVGGVVIVFSMWWLYFGRPAGELLVSLKVAVGRGYGHLVVFAAAAAVGAGFEVAIGYAHHDAHVGVLLAGWAVSPPVAVYLLGIWLLLELPRGFATSLPHPVAAVLIVLAPLTHAAVLVTAALLATLVATTIFTRPVQRLAAPPPRHAAVE